jgi:hypothetical protein
MQLGGEDEEWIEDFDEFDREELERFKITKDTLAHFINVFLKEYDRYMRLLKLEKIPTVTDENGDDFKFNVEYEELTDMEYKEKIDKK